MDAELEYRGLKAIVTVDSETGRFEASYLGCPSPVAVTANTITDLETKYQKAVDELLEAAKDA